MSAPILRAEAVSKDFGGFRANDGMSLALEAGELHALIGPNGAGKTTFLKLLAGELAPSGGRIFLDDRDVTALPVHARAQAGIARSFQISSLFPSFTAEAATALCVQVKRGGSLGMWRNAASFPELREPARQLLGEVGLEAAAQLPAERLAHGQQRELELAMALAGSPRVLLLDEPMAGLGIAEATRMVELLRGMRGRYSILLVEHDMDAVFALADRVSVMAEGRLLACGKPDQIRSDAAVLAAYVVDDDDW